MVFMLLMCTFVLSFNGMLAFLWRIMYSSGDEQRGLLCNLRVDPKHLELEAQFDTIWKVFCFGLRVYLLLCAGGTADTQS